MALITAKLNADNKKSKAFTDSVSDVSFDFLAIGNSITRHGITSFWWGYWGMAASDSAHDYYHIVVDRLRNKRAEDINTAIVSGYTWELQGHDRDEAWEIIDPYLTHGIDLITVQLSENASNLTTFETDFRSLLQHIREICGSGTQIIVIDDFWNDEKSRIKKEVANELKVDFVDLSDIRGKSEYQAGMGTKVMGDDGQKHVIEHNGVASHPGDKGMEVIAKRVLDFVE